jgi:hypothetical protein
MSHYFLAMAIMGCVCEHVSAVDLYYCYSGIHTPGSSTRLWQPPTRLNHEHDAGYISRESQVFTQSLEMSALTIVTSIEGSAHAVSSLFMCITITGRIDLSTPARNAGINIMNCDYCD